MLYYFSYKISSADRVAPDKSCVFSSSHDFGTKNIFEEITDRNGHNEREVGVKFNGSTNDIY
jgi:hypothetical protein